MSGETRFAFDKQFILDYDVAVSLEAASRQSSGPSSSAQSSSGTASALTQKSKSKAQQESNLVKCHKCKKNVDLKQMRVHVGVHIMKGEISNCCGFCGQQNRCENVLVESSKGKGRDYYKVASKCDYFVHWAKVPQFSARMPCSNTLVHCLVCKASIWTYNAHDHYSRCHPDFEAPVLVTAEEEKKMKKKK